MIGFAVTIKQFYYQGIANAFVNQAETTIPIWATGLDFSNSKLTNFAHEIIKNYQFKGAELKLLTISGKLIQSSTGFYEDIIYSLDPSVLTLKPNYETERN